jgi:hypothetical protein
MLPARYQSVAALLAHSKLSFSEAFPSLDLAPAAVTGRMTNDGLHEYVLYVKAAGPFGRLDLFRKTPTQRACPGSVRDWGCHFIPLCPNPASAWPVWP